MNEEIDDSEFYHQDFTTASDWEVFIARIEEIILQWKKEELTDETPEEVPVWTIKTESLSLEDVEFNLSLYRRKTIQENEKKNPFDSNFDFELFNPESVANHTIIATWYGINDFIVLCPSGNAWLNTETKIKVVLSALYVVAGNTKCEIPLFVQIREKWQSCYLGVYECEGIRTNLEMVHLKYGPRLCQYLSGLMELFRSKITTTTFTSKILVSAQFTYTLQDFGNYSWKQDYINSESDFDPNSLFLLPFGVTIDPIHSLIQKTTWLPQRHIVVNDSEGYSSFNPMSADKWSLLFKSTEQPLCLLGEAITEFLHVLGNFSTIYDILGDFAYNPAVDNNPLDVLTEPKVPTISSLITRATRSSLGKNKRGTAAPLNEDILVPILYFLFPDAENDSPHIYEELFTFNNDLGKVEGFNLDYECRGCKSCPSNSLIWRLAIVLAHCLQSLGGLKAFAHLWFEFVQEMRYRWEKSISIPGLLPGSPDLRTCLLHQKLQMLNCCIDRKKLRESSTAAKFESPVESSSSEDEEFFDCAEKPTEEPRKKQKYSLWNQPVGRLGKFNDLKLIKTGDSLYIPITQEPVPKSEDQLEEDTNVLLKLGSDAQGSELRAKLMSASLLSDMESFKAANPGSILEDFIRWYSPRDWIENEELDEWGQKKGELSSRMLIEDNFWKQTWNSAKPVAANRQKRLFDDTREAEKVLHFLDSRTIAQICELLIPVLCHCAIYKIVEEADSVKIELPIQEKLPGLIKIVEKITRDSNLQQRRFEGFIQEITNLELKISQINSLMYKLNPSGSQHEYLSNFIANLIKGKEVEIVDRAESDLGKRILKMFSDALKNANMILPTEENSKQDDALPQPTEKEFVLRVAAPRPSAAYSAESPQFMRSVLGKKEFRLVGAFSEDVMFF